MHNSFRFFLCACDIVTVSCLPLFCHLWCHIMKESGLLCLHSHCLLQLPALVQQKESKGACAGLLSSARAAPEGAASLELSLTCTACTIVKAEP